MSLTLHSTDQSKQGDRIGSGTRKYTLPLNRWSFKVIEQKGVKAENNLMGPFLQIVIREGNKEMNSSIFPSLWIMVSLIKHSFIYLAIWNRRQMTLSSKGVQRLSFKFPCINYNRSIGVKKPWSRAKNGPHHWTSCEKQVRFQKHWLQKLNYLNQKPNADDQISSWQYLIWSTGSHLLFCKWKLSNKCRQSCADLKFRRSLRYLALIRMQFRSFISKGHYGLPVQGKTSKGEILLIPSPQI